MWHFRIISCDSSIGKSMSLKKGQLQDWEGDYEIPQYISLMYKVHEKNSLTAKGFRGSGLAKQESKTFRFKHCKLTDCR